MMTINILRTACFAVLVLAGFAQKSFAQVESPDLAFSANSAKSIAMSFENVKSITSGSIHDLIGNQLKAVSNSDVSNLLANKFSALESGRSIGYAMPIGSATTSITQQHTLNVKVNYDARPVGGILNVRVEILPVFSGIGAANRPVVVREVAQAVDQLDQNQVSQIVADLSRQIGTEFALK